MTSICTLRSHCLFHLQPPIHSGKLNPPSSVAAFGAALAQSLENLDTNRRYVLRATIDFRNSDENRDNRDDAVTLRKDIPLDFKNPVKSIRNTISSLPHSIVMMKKNVGNNIWIGLCIATGLLIFAIRSYVARKSRQRLPGSVADLVRRGQLRSDRRGISKHLKYEDPFNNPFVKVDKNSSTVEMCGKVYKLSPVTLTKEEQAIHQKRRSRAYQWKSPKVFLKEGDPIPPDVDPDTVRWIPANHPFATTANDIDEGLAQKNIYQKHGVPFRIQAEHEALQRKLQALQSDEKFNNLVIDSQNARDFHRSFKFSPKSDEIDEQNSPEGQTRLY